MIAHAQASALQQNRAHGQYAGRAAQRQPGAQQPREYARHPVYARKQGGQVVRGDFVSPRATLDPLLCGPGCRLHVLCVRNMRASERASERVHHQAALRPTLSVTGRHLVGVLLSLRKHLADALAE